jgi:hypothetical protein
VRGAWNDAPFLSPLAQAPPVSRQPCC